MYSAAYDKSSLCAHRKRMPQQCSYTINIIKWSLSFSNSECILLLIITLMAIRWALTGELIHWSLAVLQGCPVQARVRCCIARVQWTQLACLCHAQNRSRSIKLIGSKWLASFYQATDPIRAIPFGSWCHSTDFFLKHTAHVLPFSIPPSQGSLFSAHFLQIQFA